MYYSIGFGDQRHHLRVAVSDHPSGPYTDTGTLLTDPFTCAFAIDPSPFQDDDGSWYLFYARDFLDTDNGARVGTGVVVDRLVDATRLAGESRTVMRAHQDWQRFQRDRIIYGAVYDWHTIEGPCARKRHNRYWCLYSAGCWENDTYGVDYAVADDVMGPYYAGDDSVGPRLLHTIPGKVTGPGHNSIVSGPEPNVEYIAYHAWDTEGKRRRMYIQPIVWTPIGPRLKYW
jgi:GH43 family beta-xylosidase